MKPFLLLADCLAAAALVWLLNWAALIPFRRAKDLHWTERARRLYPARLGASTMTLILPANLLLAQNLLWPGGSPHWALAGVAAWIGSVAGTYPFNREVLPWLTPGDWATNLAARWLIWFAVWFLVAGAAFLMPEQFGWRTALVTLLPAVGGAYCAQAVEMPRTTAADVHKVLSHDEWSFLINFVGYWD